MAAAADAGVRPAARSTWLASTRISAIVGLREFLSRHGEHVVEETLLRPGTPRRDWKNTLLSDGYIVVRHPDWDEARRMAFAAATDIRLYAS